MPQGDVEAPHGMTRIAPLMRRRCPDAVRSSRAASGGAPQRANHKCCSPSTQTHQKHAMPEYAAIIPQWARKPQLTRRQLDTISAGSLCRAQRQRSAGPLRDTRRALCHVVRRFWQPRYRLVWERSSSSTPSDPGATSNQMFSMISKDRGMRAGAILPRWVSATSLDDG